MAGLKFIGGIENKDWAKDGKQLSHNYPQGNRVYDTNGIACSQTANGGGIGSYTGLYATNIDNTERNKSEMCTEINKEDFRVRKLTPKECWRLMGFDDEDFYKAEKVCSNTQLYKQAGNSIVVNVLEHIYRELAKHNEHFTDGISMLSLFSGIGAFEKAMDRYNSKDF